MLPLRFRPYLGKKYSNEEFKIMILGESHYLNKNHFTDYLDNERSIESITVNVVSNYLDYKKNNGTFVRWMNTFTKFGNVFNGKRLSNQETIDFWEKCCFYNYVQAPTRGPRISPSKHEFTNSINAFTETVNLTKPNIAIFWGKRLWRNFPKASYKMEELNDSELHYLKLDYYLPILVIPHPSSSSFNYKFTEVIKNYISLIKTVGNKI